MPCSTTHEYPPPIDKPHCPTRGPFCLPCGMDNVTLRRPLIVHDSTFDFRPTSWPGMLLNHQDKKIRYQLINFDRPCQSHYPSCSPTYYY